MAEKATIGCENTGGISFTLPSVMTIETVESIAAELKQLPLAEKTGLTLDAALVESITTPGLQLIVSLERTLAAQGGTFAIHGQREGFARTFRDAGLEELLRKTQ